MSGESSSVVKNLINCCAPEPIASKVYIYNLVTKQEVNHNNRVANGERHLPLKLNLFVALMWSCER